MATNIMVDLETLGSNSKAVILSLGAAVFDAEKIIDTFYVPIDAQSCVDAGLTIDVSTVVWWMKQSDRARAAVSGEGLPLATALGAFSDFVFQHASSADSVALWGNGATFDNVILRNAYNAVKLPCPWKYWGDACYRTLKNLAPEVTLERSGTAHNALDDAVSQANHLIAVARYLKLNIK